MLTVQKDISLGDTTDKGEVYVADFEQKADKHRQKDAVMPLLWMYVQYLIQYQR